MQNIDISVDLYSATYILWGKKRKRLFLYSQVLKYSFTKLKFNNS